MCTRLTDCIKPAWIWISTEMKASWPTHHSQSEVIFILRQFSLSLYYFGIFSSVSFQSFTRAKRCFSEYKTWILVRVNFVTLWAFIFLGFADEFHKFVFVQNVYCLLYILSCELLLLWNTQAAAKGLAPICAALWKVPNALTGLTDSHCPWWRHQMETFSALLGLTVWGIW